jgi:hypothetical protein
LLVVPEQARVVVHTVAKCRGNALRGQARHNRGGQHANPKQLFHFLPSLSEAMCETDSLEDVLSRLGVKRKLS